MVKKFLQVPFATVLWAILSLTAFPLLSYAADSSPDKWSGAVIYTSDNKVSSGVPVSKCHILSNEHAVRNQQKVNVTLLGKRHQATVVSIDKTNDLSLLSVSGCPINHFAKISKVQPMKGDQVTSIYYRQGRVRNQIAKTSGHFLGYLDIVTEEDKNMFSMLIDDNSPRKGASGGGVATKNGLVSVIFGVSSQNNRHQTFAVDFFSFSTFLKKNHIQI